MNNIDASLYLVSLSLKAASIREPLRYCMSGSLTIRYSLWFLLNQKYRKYIDENPRLEGLRKRFKEERMLKSLSLLRELHYKKAPRRGEYPSNPRISIGNRRLANFIQFSGEGPIGASAIRTHGSPREINGFFTTMWRDRPVLK